MSSLAKRIAGGHKAIKQVVSRTLKKTPSRKWLPTPPRSTRADRKDGHRAKIAAKRSGRWGWRRVKRGGVQHSRNWSVMS